MASAPASVEEGFDDERFQTAVPQNLHCVICLNVLRKPMQCVRNEHSFCKPCITRHLQTTPRCPTCIEPLTLATLRPSRLVTDLLSQLMIRCDNFHRGCPESVKMEMLEAHVQNCEFSPVHCSNDGCEVIINRKDQADHENNDCDHRQGKCEVCGEQVRYGKRQLHCYVTRNEVDNLTHEISSIEEVVTNLSQQLTHHMTDMNASMVDTMVHMNRRVNNLERMFKEHVKKEQSIKQEPQIDIRPSGSTACVSTYPMNGSAGSSSTNYCDVSNRGRKRSSPEVESDLSKITPPLKRNRWDKGSYSTPSLEENSREHVRM